jgi:methylated-DNA-[protein]-cysteine S-methyltransferase
MNFPSTLYKTNWQGPLGEMIVAASDTGIVGIWFEGQKHLPDHSKWNVRGDHPLLVLAVAQLGDYFAGRRTSFDLPLDLQGGTAFQQSVWHALLAIPHGAKTTYASIGRDIGSPQAVRAVGAAVGRNPLSIVVPCHRVLGAGGSLTGYAGGLDRKSALLKLEGAI